MKNKRSGVAVAVVVIIAVIVVAGLFVKRSMDFNASLLRFDNQEDMLASLAGDWIKQDTADDTTARISGDHYKDDYKSGTITCSPADGTFTVTADSGMSGEYEYYYLVTKDGDSAFVSADHRQDSSYYMVRQN